LTKITKQKCCLICKKEIAISNSVRICRAIDYILASKLGGRGKGRSKQKTSLK